MKYRHLTAIALTAVLTPAVQAARPIEEILVTAQKREQYIEEIPFSITAIGRVAIEERDITDIAAVGQMVPNLQVTHAPGGSTSAQIAIRGGVTINPALTWETTVGLYVDGVYIGKTQGSIGDVVNIERVEVLRGPQGTLYGRNTLAGGINIVTRAPSGELSGHVRAGLGNLGQPPTIPAGTSADTSFDDVTPTFSLTYALNDTTSAYVRYAEGFKSGGFNGEAQTVAETVRPYSSETVRSVEAGVKGVWFDNALRASAAVFQNDHKNMQLSVFTAEGAAGSSVRNAGRARIRGFELEGSMQVGEAIAIVAGYGYLDPNYKEFLDCGGTLDVAANRAFPHAPEHSFNASLDARLLSSGWGNLALILDYNRVSEHYLYPFPITPDTNPACAPSALAPDTEVGNYGLANARLILSDVSLGKQTSMTASLWVMNLGDEEYRANMIDFGPAFARLTTAYYGLPRTYGVDLTWRW